MKKEITFIILTKDRKNLFLKFFDNFYMIFKNKLIYKFLIIDGGSFKDSFFLSKGLKKYRNLRYIKQTSTGFMNGCFEAINYIDTKYCTFIYDDDILSPHIVQIYDNLLPNGNFSMGYGLVAPKNSKYESFKYLSQLDYKKEEMLLGYYGINKFNVKTLPVSPVCTIFKKNFLFLWKKEIIKFCFNNRFRTLFLLKKNIGPDLMIYLFNIFHEKKKINFYKPHCAIFVGHPKSMSVILGTCDLKIGYWLAKVSLLLKMNNNKIKDKLYTFLIIDGLSIVILNLLLIFSSKRFYLLGLIQELILLFRRRNKFLFIHMYKILINKLYRIVKLLC
jgi:hypothetical protein